MIGIRLKVNTELPNVYIFRVSSDTKRIRMLTQRNSRLADSALNIPVDGSPRLRLHSYSRQTQFGIKV